MQFIIINGSALMFSDFLAAEIGKNPGFANSKPVTTSSNNRYKYPNYLDVIGVDPRKLVSTQSWPITEANLNTLETLYSGLKVEVVTDWYNTDLTMTNLPSTGVYPYSSSEDVIRLAFAMDWIKYLANPTEPSAGRQAEINQLIAANDSHKDQLTELLEPGKYVPWKFLFCKNPAFEGQPYNLRAFMEDSYNNVMACNQNVDRGEWFKFDFSAPLLTNTGYEGIENLLGITLDKAAIQNYHAANVALLTEKTGLTMSSISSPTWMDSLYNYCASI